MGILGCEKSVSNVFSENGKWKGGAKASIAPLPPTKQQAQLGQLLNTVGWHLVRCCTVVAANPLTLDTRGENGQLFHRYHKHGHSDIGFWNTPHGGKSSYRFLE